MNDTDKTPKLDLEIYGQAFRVRAPEEDHERLQDAARHVTQVMRKLENTQTSPDTARLAMQAALLISADYHKLKDEFDDKTGATAENKRRVDMLIERLEESLKSL